MPLPQTFTNRQGTIDGAHMKIEIATLKRIARAVPELTIAQLVAVWAEKIEDQRRETEKDRIAGKRATPANNEPTSCNIDQHSPTREEQESALFKEAKTICGRQAGGMVTALLKQHGYDIEAVRQIFAAAHTKGDPRAYVAASIRRPNGPGNDIMATFDRLIAEEKVRAGSGEGPLLDLTPTSSRTG